MTPQLHVDFPVNKNNVINITIFAKIKSELKIKIYNISKSNLY